MKNSQPLLPDIAREVLRRREAATGLIPFTRYTNAQYQAARHHLSIAEALEKVESGEIDRLMIFMPPRHGKSELASRRFPAWYLGRNPAKQIISASYSSDLSGDFGREVRNIVADPLYRNVFDVELRQDSKAANRWHTDQDGVYVSAGVCTAITGRGADIALIDDPFKDRQEADSQTRREHVYRWYQSTLYTRLMPNAAIILIQTRWHEDDLAGRLLTKMEEGGDQWTVVELPALSDAGEALWPEWYPVPALQRIQTAVGPREWSALYQQKPQPDEGTFFQRDYFPDASGVPQVRNIYITSDFAVTDDAGDFTEHAVWALDSDDVLQPVDWWYGQKTADVWIDALADLILKWQPLCWFGESGVIRRAVEPFLTRRLLERKAYVRQEWVASISDKPTRARAFQARASMGKVKLPHREEWAQRLLSQLLVFPAGRHDDAVDCCSLMGMVIDQAHPAIVVVDNSPNTQFEARIRSLEAGQKPDWQKGMTADPWDRAWSGDEFTTINTGE